MGGGRLSGGARVGGPEMGWIVGEAIVQENALAGNIAFYPYHDRFMNLPARSASAGLTNVSGLPSDTRPGVYEGRRDWRPKRVN